MKLWVLVVLMLFAASSHAATWETFTFPNGEGALSISEEPCSVPSVALKWARIRAGVKAQHSVDIGEPKQSRLLWKGTVYSGCYIIDPYNGGVYNIDSTGEKLMPPLPRGAFVPHESALPPGSQKL